MLPKASRLPITRRFFVTRFGTRLTNPWFSLTVFPNSLPTSQWLIEVPKKNIPRAHDRNRLRRVIGEALLSLSPSLRSLDGVLRVTKPQPLITSALAQKELEAVLVQYKISK